MIKETSPNLMKKDNVWYHKQSVSLEEKIISQFRAEGIWDKIIWSSNEFERSETNGDELLKFNDHFYKKVPRKFTPIFIPILTPIRKCTPGGPL